MAELGETDPAASGGLFGACAALLERLCSDVSRRLPPHAAHGLLMLEGALRGGWGLHGSPWICCILRTGASFHWSCRQHLTVLQRSSRIPSTDPKP